MKRIVFSILLVMLLTACRKDNEQNNSTIYGSIQFTINGDGFNNITFSNAGINTSTTVTYDAGTTEIANEDMRDSNGQSSSLVFLVDGLPGTGIRYLCCNGAGQSIQIQVGSNTYTYSTDSSTTVDFTRYDPYPSTTLFTAITAGNFTGTFYRYDSYNNLAATVYIAGKFSAYREI